MKQISSNSKLILASKLNVKEEWSLCTWLCVIANDNELIDEFEGYVY